MCVCVFGGWGSEAFLEFYCGNFSTPGGGGVRTPGPTLLLYYTGYIWNRIVNYICILAVVSDDALL